MLKYVDGRIHSRRREREKLLAELTPLLQAARRVERELDRHLARRFSVFKYLRTDELGLSRISWTQKPIMARGHCFSRRCWSCCQKRAIYP
ncbi:MAG: hypothetical protein F4X41_00420 [Chloroflexi bacterium]|nr:hypothetical protein [Chloroflexota bacterium]